MIYSKLGLDVHDAWISPTTLEVGMIITVEPGVYINEVSIELGLADQTLAQYLVAEEINKYVQMGIGGVRIEDDVLVTSTGAQLLSTGPRSIEDIEAWMQK